MKKFLLPLALLSAAAVTPAAAVERPVAPWELDSFIGKQLQGDAFAPLGIVSAANEYNGLIAIVGRHGEVATIHASMLVSNGKQNLRAPSLTTGDIAAVSYGGMSGVPIVDPRIIIEEYPLP